MFQLNDIRVEVYYHDILYSFLYHQTTDFKLTTNEITKDNCRDREKKDFNQEEKKLIHCCYLLLLNHVEDREIPLTRTRRKEVESEVLPPITRSWIIRCNLIDRFPTPTYSYNN